MAAKGMCLCLCHNPLRVAEHQWVEGPPSDRMIVGSHHISPHHAITFKCIGSLSHQLADDRGHGRASLGTVPCSFLLPAEASILISHCQNPVSFVFGNIYTAHSEYFTSHFPYSVHITSSDHESFMFLSPVSRLVNHVWIWTAWFMRLPRSLSRHSSWINYHLIGQLLII